MSAATKKKKGKTQTKTKKQTAKVGGESGDSAGSGRCDPRIVKIVITWCDESCDRWEQEVDLAQCDGMIWKDTAHKKPPPSGVPNPNARRLPKTKDPKPKGKCHELPPSGPSYCWFNGSSWVCPDGL